MVGAAMAEREAWADVDVSASDRSHLSGSRDGWDQAGDVGDIGQVDGADGG